MARESRGKTKVPDKHGEAPASRRDGTTNIGIESLSATSYIVTSGSSAREALQDFFSKPHVALMCYCRALLQRASAFGGGRGRWGKAR